MSLSRHLAAQWSKLGFSKGRTTHFQNLSPPTVFKLQHTAFAGVNMHLMWKKVWLDILDFLNSFFITIFSKLFVGRVRKTSFFRIFWPRKKNWDKKSEMSNHTFLPTRLVKFGAKSVACTMKTEGGVGIWVSKTYAKIRAGRHLNLGVVRLADVDFFWKISNFMVKWY